MAEKQKRSGGAANLPGGAGGGYNSGGKEVAPVPKDSPELKPSHPSPDEKSVARQASAANGFRKRQGLPPVDHELKLVPLDSIKPSQHGEDYINDSSKELARKVAGGKRSDRQQDNDPIALDESNNIVDGNHRHAAATMNGEKAIWAIVPKTQPAPTTPTLETKPAKQAKPKATVNEATVAAHHDKLKPLVERAASEFLPQEDVERSIEEASKLPTEDLKELALRSTGVKTKTRQMALLELRGKLTFYRRLVESQLA